MKLAFLTYNRDPSIPDIDNDGCPVTVRQYALKLETFGHEIDIYANKIFPSKESSLYLKNKFRKQKEGSVKIGKLTKVIRVPIHQPAFAKSPLLSKELADIPEIVESIACMDFFRDKKLFEYDVVCLFHPLASFGPLLCGLTPLDKTVLFPMLLSDEYKKYQSVSSIYEELETFALKSVRCIFSCSDSERTRIMKKGISASAVKVILRGFDDVVFSHHVKERNRTNNNSIKMICVGSIKPQKQQLQFVEIVSRLKENGFNPIVTIVGGNKNFIKEEYKAYYESIINKIKECNLQDHFIFTGSITPTQIAEQFRINDLAVFPSIGESFGKAALEAICSGIPTILNGSVDAYKDFAKQGENALFYRVTGKACVDQIQRIVLDPIRYTALSRCGAKTGKKFGWQTVSLELEKQLLRI